MKDKKWLGPLVLVLAAMIWGLSFVFQSESVKHIETFTFNAMRALVGALTLLPVMLIRERKLAKKAPKTNAQKKRTLLSFLIVGSCLCVSVNLQQEAFRYIVPGKVGFITALYMLFVPVIAFVFLKRKQPFTVWLGVALGVAGMYLLCLGTGADVSFGKGELLTLICAVLFAVHILAIDAFADEVDAVTLSFGQFLVTGVVSGILMFLFETPSWSNIVQAGVPILYAGIMSSGVAFTFQVLGQKHTDPTIASMLLCLESVFSVLFSALLLHIRMQPHEYIGCAIMFVAILLAQLPAKKKSEA